MGVDEDDGDLEVELKLLLEDAGQLLCVLGLGHAPVLPVLYTQQLTLFCPIFTNIVDVTDITVLSPTV